MSFICISPKKGGLRTAPTQTKMRDRARRVSCLLRFAAFALFAPAVWAQQAALPPETPAALRQDIKTVNPPAAAPFTANASARALFAAPASSAFANSAPLTTATPERDPFEVSPQLREGNRRNRHGGFSGTQEGVVLSRNLHLKAIARGPAGGIAQIQSGRDVLTLRDGDELDVEGMRYTVHVEQDGLVLRGAGAPQFKLLVR